jgi:hypothetical protein
MLKKWLCTKLIKFLQSKKLDCDCEKYFLDTFDKEHLYFVALGVTTMENYIEMKKMYYRNRVDKISSLGVL